MALAAVNVLTVNPGSSSLRVHLVDSAQERVLDAVEVGRPADSDEARTELERLLDRIPEPQAVAHRIVHGGEEITAPVALNPRVFETILAAAPLAPLHQRNSIALIELLTGRLAHVPHIVCPDTAFHAGLPLAARTYAVPPAWGLRRYGFHGISYGWALRRTIEMLGVDQHRLCVVLAHLSGGSSICAVEDGRSVDTTMGGTPLEGLPMATRSGSVDPGLLLWLLREGKFELDALEHALLRKSGLLGLSELSADTRDLVPAADDGHSGARLAIDVFVHRIRREIAAAAACLPRLDAVVFTGDIGWNQPEIPEAVCQGLVMLGITGHLNTERDHDRVISPPGAAIPVLTVRSREELQLASLAAAAV